MFVIHGKYERNRVRGFVGDYCPVCGRLQIFHVTDALEIDHVYFVPLGEGDLKATTIDCIRCQTPRDAVAEDYDQILNVKGNPPICPWSVSDVVRRTNARLTLVRAIIDRVTRLSEGSDLAESSNTNMRTESTDRWQRIFSLLQEHYRGDERLDALLARLADCSSQTPARQSTLQEEVEDFLEEKRERSRTLAFLTSIASTAPEGSFLYFFIAIATAAICFMVGVALDSAEYMVGGMIAALVMMPLCYAVLGPWRLRRWVAKKLVPRAEAENIDMVTLCSVLTGIDPTAPHRNKQLIAVAKKAKKIIQIMFEQGHLQDLETFMANEPK